MSIDALIKYWNQYDYANVYQRCVDNPDAKISKNEKSVMSDFARIVSVVNLFLESHLEKTEDGRFSKYWYQYDFANAYFFSRNYNNSAGFVVCCEILTIWNFLNCMLLLF